MASFFGHTIASVALGKAFTAEKQALNFWLLAAYCSVIPDGDVISFYFGIPYGHLLGHRGFSHSIVFSAILGMAVTFAFFRHVPRYSARWWKYAIFFFLVTISHGIADALTNGGLGVAFFSPLSNERYFFPWRPIDVSPIGGLIHFFEKEGWAVIKSEIVWIWIPSIALVLCSKVIRRFLNHKTKQAPTGGPQ